MEQPNLTYIENLSGGDKTFEVKLIDVIKAEFPLEKDTYFKNIEAKNYEEASKHVHKLKHKISILGLKKSYEVAIAYENSLLKGKTEQQELFEVILNNITNYLKTL